MLLPLDAEEVALAFCEDDIVSQPRYLLVPGVDFRFGLCEFHPHIREVAGERVHFAGEGADLSAQRGRSLSRSSPTL